MRLGGLARYVLEVETPQEAQSAYNFAATWGLPTFVLGYGANSLGYDQGFPGAIIINRMRGIQEEETETGVRLRVMGGEYWDDVVKYACERGLTGIEALSKIPGLAGAAPVQNIGAYGQELSDTLAWVEVFDAVHQNFMTLSKADLQMSYRKSILNTTAKGRYFVIAIGLELRKGEMPKPYYRGVQEYLERHQQTDVSPQGIRAAVSAIREEKLPDPQKIASAGSFFKNVYVDDAEAERCDQKGIPVYRGVNDGVNKVNSAWLIEKAGLAGQLLHGIRVSEKAPLVLINESAQSFNDLAKARDEIVGCVYDKFGFWLEQEPVEIK